MNRPILLHPFLVAIYPVLFLTAVNLTQIGPTVIVRPLITVVVTATVLLLATKMMVKDWQRAGLLVSFGLFLFFNHNYTGLQQVAGLVLPAEMQADRPALAISLWIGGLWLGCYLIVRKLREPRTPTVFLNIFASIAIFTLTVYIARYLIEAGQRSQVAWALPVEGLEAAPPSSAQPLPDIYYIIVDGYGRGDILQEIYQYDNEPFLDSLRRKGFFVAQDSRSNYVQTTLSLASSMNFQYLGELAQTIGKHVGDRKPLTTLIQHSQARDFLSARGYRTVAIGTGYDFTAIPEADIFIPPPQRTFTSFEDVLVRSSALAVIRRHPRVDNFFPLSYRAHRERILYALDQLKNMPSVSGPKFVLAHLISPHPPFIFGPHGEEIEHEVEYSISDGSEYAGPPEEYIRLYRDQLTHLNTLLEEAIDEILAKSSTPPIIILQGDHGGGALLDWASAEKTCLRERLSILNAYYLPGNDSQQLDPSITPVNSFRVILNAYFGANLSRLEDRSYFSTLARPYDFIDVTDEIEGQTCNVPQLQ